MDPHSNNARDGGRSRRRNGRWRRNPDDAELWFGELLRTATELEGMLDEADKKVQKAHIEAARKFLDELCRLLKKVVAALEGKSSPLGRFFAEARDVPAEKDKQKAKKNS